MKLPDRHGQTASPDPHALPPPTAEEQAHSTRLQQRLREEIAARGGSLSFARFMELALYAPGLGYYAVGKHKFGAPGDFITAPEMGSLFARCLARPCRSILAQLGGGDILEAGAGSGALAADLLLELEALGRLPESYLILELSNELRDRQAETLRRKVPHLLEHIRWLDTLPGSFHGMVLANELLDAMPVERFRIAEDGVRQFHVAWQNDRFCWQEKQADEAIRRRIEPLALPPGYTSEINLQAEAWVRSVADILEQGVMLFVDYGFPRAEFYHPQRTDGTLMCHYRHRAHDDPLTLVGLQDITAHVDFTAIAEAGTETGLSLLGYSSQAAFLIGCGLEQLMSASDPEDTRAHLELTQQVKKLTSPHEMGELYKVITLGRGVQDPFLGFADYDRRGRL
ncbi:class I SAM-dependent methyltransferase [Sulfuricaulis sp.]|jgi:SAM-dependent MidA family methyltransferase|uniref:class I SAM-dependent methyltransferase n=1 Tax=Sulfuricaulis sp. TaxID=2003553 RepID=UPI00355A489F